MSETLNSPLHSAQLACPNCQHSITYYDVEGSDYYACANCHAYFRASGEATPKVVGHYQQAPARPPIIPLGAVGTFEGRNWCLVGVVARCELHAEQYSWLEFQLFQPETKQYAQLAQFEGHWLFVQAAEQDFRPKMSGRFTYAPEGTYRLYNRYQSRVLWALGEFDWNIEDDRDVEVSEFISPPHMLVREKRGKASTWYRAEHLEPGAVAAAFGLSASVLPARQGVGAVQPDPVKASWPALVLLTTLAVGFLLFVQIGYHLLHPDTIVLRASLQVEADTTAKATPGTGRIIVSPSFTLDHAGAVEVDLTASLNNQWLELPVSLVNEQTGQGFEFTKNIEFYSGIEAGYNWTEGTRNADAVLSRVPAGRYHLNFYPFTEAGPARPQIDVWVTADPPLWSNFFIVLLLVIVFPAWQYFRRASHETDRWSASDFSPNS